MDEVNELIESLLIDVSGEGLGAILGVGMLWGMFVAGGSTVFNLVLNALASTI